MTRVKLFANRERRDLENEINDWLGTQDFESIDIQYGTDITYWSCMVVYRIKKPEKEV